MIDGPPARSNRVELIASPHIGLIGEGDDLPSIIAGRFGEGGVALRNGDILVIAQMIVSKAEGRCTYLADVTPWARAVELAAPLFASIEMAEKRVFAIVPVKPLQEGKSRLSPIMDFGERQRLNAFLMRRTFDLIAAFRGITHSIVVSSDTKVAAEAESRGIIFVEDEARDLNVALAKATQTAIVKGADAIIVLPVDLPLATSAHLKRIVPGDSDTNVCVIVPDRRGTGTNLLYVSPPCDDLYRFGPGSFALHREAAVARGFRTLEIDDPVLSLDIDEPEDYERWLHSPAGACGR